MTVTQQRTARRAAAHSRRCTICTHPEKWRLELLLAGGASVEALARKFNVGPDALSRHWKRHVSDETKTGHLAGLANLDKLAEKAAESGQSVLDYLAIARNTLLTQLSTVALAGDSRNVGYLVGQLTRVLEVIARVSGELGALATSQTFNVMNNVVLQDSPVFAKLQRALLQALQPFPDARNAVVQVPLKTKPPQRPLQGQRRRP
jgi:transposase-like protein